MTPSEPRAANRWTPFLLILLFLGLPILSFPELVAGQTLWQADISRIHYPYHIMVAGEWLAGRVPLWNPYQHLGIPLLAEPQVSVLSPLGMVFLSPFSPALELSVFILIHMTLAGLFTVGLARALGLSWAPAAVAGLAFGMGGFLMAQVGNTNIMTGAAFLPLVMWALVWALRRRTLWTAALAGGSLALQALTAQPQVVLYTGVVVLAYGSYRVAAEATGLPKRFPLLSKGFLLLPKSGERLREQKEPHREQKEPHREQQEPHRQQQEPYQERPAGGARRALVTLALLGTFLAAGMLLAAPQLLPTFELQQLSVRSDDRSYDFLTANSLPPIMALNLLLPGAFGNNVTGFKGGDPFAEDFVYIGLLALVLVFFAWGQRRRPDVPFFAILLLVTTLLALGRFTPLYRYVVQYLPGFSLFRIPSRWLMVVNLALAVLAGCGLETVLAARPSWRKSAPVVGLLAALLVATGLLVLGREQVAAWGQTLGNDFHRRLAAALVDKGLAYDGEYAGRLLLRGLLPWLTVPAGLLAANLVAALVLCVLYAVRAVPARVFGWLVVGALALDLTLAGGTTINPIKPVDWWQQLSGGSRYVLEHMTSGRVFPLGMGSELLAVADLGQFTPSAHGVLSAGGHGSPLMLARQDVFLDEAHPVQQMRILGVRYLLTEGRMGADVEATYPLVFQDDISVVYEAANPLPRAFIAHQALAVVDGEAALAEFADMDVDPYRQVVIETTDPLPALPESAPEDGGTATITLDEPQRVETATHLDQPGFLVLLDTYYPGWTARVDGRPAHIYRADYLARAVYLPAGDHTVLFVYRPVSFCAGAALALVTLLLILFLPRRRAA